MKLQRLLLVLPLCFICLLHGQSSHAQNSLFKTTSGIHQVAFSTYILEGAGTPFVFDSIRYAYSGARGIAPGGTDQYDTLTELLHVPLAPYQRSIQIFDAGDRPVERIRQDWKSSAWTNAERRAYNYDVHGNVSEELLQSWPKDSSKWVTFSATENTYNSSNLLVYSIIYGFWSSKPDTVNELHYTYNAKGKRTSGDLFKTSSSVYKLAEKDEYTYDASDTLLTTHIHYELYIVGTVDSFVPSQKHTYTYDASGRVLTDLTEKIDADFKTWNYAGETHFTYDAGGNKVTDLSLQHTDTTSRITYTFQHNLLVSALTEFRSGPGLKPSSINYYYYDADLTGIPVVNNIQRSIDLFPVPATGQLTIALNDHKNLRGTNARVLDQAGKVLRNFKLDNELNLLDISTLPAGMYFCNFENGMVKPFIKKD